MLTSMFSHSSFLHLTFNVIALNGFASSTSHWLVAKEVITASDMPESTSIYHFLSFYLSAGLASTLVSHLVSTRVLYPRLLASVSASPPAAFAARQQGAWQRWTSAARRPTADASAAAAAVARPILPSLGASGAIYACFALTAFAFPSAQIALVFLPTYNFSALTGLGGLVALDLLGVVRGWRTFDHFAHLGGAAFGTAYFMYGMPYWVWLRKLEAESHAAGREEEEEEERRRKSGEGGDNSKQP